MSEPTALERSLAQLLARFRREHLDPINNRLDQIERDLQIEKRIAALEQRAGIEPGEPQLILPESWINGSGRG